MEPDGGMFRALIERCPLVTYVCDADGAITYISPQIEEWTGRTSQLWVDDPTFWHTMIHPEDFDRVIAADRSPDALDIEYRIPHRDGGWLWVWEREVTAAGEEGSHGVLMDITALRETREALQASQDRLGAIVNAAPVMLFATDPAGSITVSEGKALERVGLAPGETVGGSIFDVWAHVPEIEAHARRALAGGSFDNRIEIDGLTFDCTWRGMVDGSMIAIAIDVTARHHSEARLAHLAYHDPLTGVANRSAVEEQLGRELERARRDDQAVAVLYLDLDHFKLVNDSLGHAAGDQVLIEVASRIRAVIRGGDLLARLAGDEFIVVCPGISRAGAEAVADKVLAALDDSLVVDGEEFQIGASIGIAVGPRDGASAADLLKHADTAMYQAKRSGRDAHALYRPGADDGLDKLTLTARLRRALADDEFVLRYQPVFNLATGKVAGMEALVRWEDPAIGTVMPDRFIPHAEQTGLIGHIGAWVLEEVCRQGAEWTAAGLLPRLAFNASPRELRDDCYVDRVADTLARHGLRPEQVLIEVRESAMDDYDRSRKVIGRLHRLGIKLALDDFGTEHSSLSRLRALPVQVLKVDRSFLRDVPGDAASCAMVRGIATMGAGLGMDVVAEGIENVEQLRFAADAGCGFGQGYHFARPLEAADMAVLLTSSLAPERRAARAPARSPAGLRR